MKTISLYGPFDEYCGYGARARDLANCTVFIEKYKFEFVPLIFSNSSTGFLQDWDYISSKLTDKPTNDTAVVVNIPAPDQNFGKKNILITAGIETDIFPKDYIEHAKTKDLILTSSTFSQRTIAKFVPEVPCQVLFEAYNPAFLKKPQTDFFKQYYSDEEDFLNEDFIFLCVGHWLPGALGHDRKNIGFTIASFYKAFANHINPPALLLKTQAETSPSLLDFDEITDRIKKIKTSVPSNWHPNVYLLSGTLSDQEMNAIYKHPKVKAFALLTHGEGYGRPYLEFSLTGKPIIASHYSGHLDFLNSEQATLVDGTIGELDKSSKYHPIFEEGSKWFFPDERKTIDAFRTVYKKYNKHAQRAATLAQTNKANYSLKQMAEQFKTYLDDVQ